MTGYHRFDDVSVIFWSIKMTWFLYAGQFKWRNVCCILANLKTMLSVTFWPI